MGDPKDSFFAKSEMSLASRLLEVGFEPGDLASAFGVCPLLLLHGEGTEANIALSPLLDVIGLAYSMLGDSSERVAAWLDEPNVAFHSTSPREMILMRRENDVLMFLRERVNHENYELFGG
jgi:hypothetical protein